MYFFSIYLNTNLQSQQNQQQKKVVHIFIEVKKPADQTDIFPLQMLHADGKLKTWCFLFGCTSLP